MSKDYVIKIGIGSSTIDEKDYAVLMLDHIDFDSLLRSAAMFEFMKPNLKPLKPEHPLFFGQPTDVMGIDDDLEVSIRKAKKIIYIKIQSRSILNDLLEKADERTLEKAKKDLPSMFFDFNSNKKYFDQEASMIFSGIYKDSYRGFINAYQDQGFFLVILGHNGTAMPGVQLVIENVTIV